MIKITFDENSLNTAKKLLAISPVKVRKAASNAIGRTVSSMRSKVSKHIRQTYTARATAIKGTITAKGPTRDNLQGTLRASGSALNLTYFRLLPNPMGVIKLYKTGAKPKKRQKPMRVQIKVRGVTASVPGLFIQKSSRSGYAGPMHRYTKTAYPIKIPYGPSVPQMFGSKDVLSTFTPESEQYLNKRFLHEIKRQFSGVK